MNDDKTKIDSFVSEFNLYQTDATKLIMKMIFFLNYGGIILTITALVSSNFSYNKSYLKLVLFIFMLGLLFSIFMALGMRQFAYHVYQKSLESRKNNPSNFDTFLAELTPEINKKFPSWKSIIYLCSVFGVICFGLGLFVSIIILYY